MQSATCPPSKDQSTFSLSHIRPGVNTSPIKADRRNAAGCPAAARNDRVVKVSAAQHTARMVPHATLLVYRGVGHAPHLEVVTRFNRDLAEFVRSIR